MDFSIGLRDDAAHSLNRSSTKLDKILGIIDQRISDHNIELPTLSPPMAALLRATRILGPRLLVSAQLPRWDGKLIYTGKVGDQLDLATGQQAARLCALNVIAHCKQALEGDLDRVEAVASVRGYVNASPDFFQIAETVNGASQVILDIFGPEIGAHTRTAVGAASMPFNASLEVEAEFFVRS